MWLRTSKRTNERFGCAFVLMMKNVKGRERVCVCEMSRRKITGGKQRVIEWKREREVLGKRN